MRIRPSSAELAAEIPWRGLVDAEFAARAVPAVEAWLGAPRIEQRLLLLLDDELHQRLEQQRARRRRGGAVAGGETDLRALGYLVLMALERACEEGGGVTLVARALRLAGLIGLLSLLAGEAVAAPTWAQAHRMYARAERSGDAMLVGDAGGACEALYLRMLLLSTIAELGMTPRQIDKSFEWLAGWSHDARLEREIDPARHAFAVDLGGSAGLVPATVAGLEAPRYLAHGPLAGRAAAARADYFREISVSTLGLYDSNPLFEYLDALHQLSGYWAYVCARLAGKDTGREPVAGARVPAEAGFTACCEALRTGTASMRWALVDQSPTGAGFKATGLPRTVERGTLTLFADPQTGTWVLGSAVRVVATAEGADIGVRRLAEQWRVVELAAEARAGRAPLHPDIAGLFVFGDEARGLSDSLVVKSGTFDPDRTYTMQPGRDVFRIRLSRVIQRAGDWEQVGFDVLKRLNPGA